MGWCLAHCPRRLLPLHICSSHFVWDGSRTGHLLINRSSIIFGHLVYVETASPVFPARIVSYPAPTYYMSGAFSIPRLTCHQDRPVTRHLLQFFSHALKNVLCGMQHAPVHVTLKRRRELVKHGGPSLQPVRGRGDVCMGD